MPAAVPIDKEQIKARGSLKRSLVESAMAARKAYDKAYWSAKSGRFRWPHDMLKHLDLELRLKKRSNVEIAQEAGITESVLANLIEVGLVPARSKWGGLD